MRLKHLKNGYFCKFIADELDVRVISEELELILNIVLQYKNIESFTAGIEPLYYLGM